jgi:protoporphyrinogen oxidase
MRKFFSYPVSLTPETVLNMGFSRTIKAGVGFLQSVIIKRKEHNLEDFMINRFGQSLYHMFFEDYTQKVWGKHPNEIDASWGAQRIKGLSLGKTLIHALKKSEQIETSLIEEFWYPKYGPGQLWEVMASEIQRRGGEIRLNTKVIGLNQSNGTIRAIQVEKDGQRALLPIRNSVVISSMPIKELITSMSNVPQTVYTIAKTLPYRDFITVGLLIKKLKLKNNTTIPTLGNIVPDNWIYIQEPDVKIGRLQIFNNWSPYMVNNPNDTIWLGLEYFADEGDALWTMDDSSMIQFAIHELVKLGFIQEEDVLDSLRLNIPKAYPAYWGSYDHFGQVQNFINSIDNLYCIGRNGQHRYNNMDHSMMTAIKTLDFLKHPISDKDCLWNVNTDGDYHEKIDKKLTS